MRETRGAGRRSRGAHPRTTATGRSLRYEIQTDAGEWETVPGGGAAREITFTNLNYNQRYIYNLRAVNEVGPERRDVD